MMEREDFIRFADKALSEFRPPPSKEVFGYSVLTTSGTTKSGVLLRLIELERGGKPTFFQEWPKGNERIILAAGSLCTRLLQLLSLRKNGGDKARGMAIDNDDLVSGTEVLIGDFVSNKLVGVPSLIVRLVEHMSTEARERIVSIRVNGDWLSSFHRRALLTQLPNIAEFDITYVSIETGVISKPTCGYLPPNHYHPQEGTIVTIANPDETGVGDILISVPDDRLVPIKDYRIGDIGRMYEKLCPCGEKRVLEVLGRRGHDYIKLAGALLRQEEFDRVARLLNAFDDYQVEASECVENGKHKGKIVIRAYRREGKVKGAFELDLADRFSRELFLTPTQTLADLVKKDLFAPLEAVYVEGPFPEGDKGVRLSRRSS